MTYAEKLRNPRWQKKRLSILERDGWKCQRCNDTTSTLHVHHRYYERGSNPWDANDGALVTLCENCHEMEDEEWLEYGPLLIYTLKKIGLWGDDVRELALSLTQYNDRGGIYRPETIMRAIGVFLSSRGMVDSAVSRVIGVKKA